MMFYVKFSSEWHETQNIWADCNFFKILLLTPATCRYPPCRYLFLPVGINNPVRVPAGDQNNSDNIVTGSNFIRLWQLFYNSNFQPFFS